MAFTPCESCECIASNEQIQVWQQNVRITLCAILDAIQASELATNVNVLSVIPGTNANELGKAQGGTWANGDTLVAGAFYREAAISSTGVASSDGKYTVGKVDANGAFYTHATASTAIIGNIRIDQTTPGTTNGVQVNAALPAGASTIGSIASVTTSVTPGTAAANLGKAEDAAAASGDTGVAIFSQQQATPTNTVSADNDYQTLKGNTVGALYNEPSNQLATYAASATAGAAGGINTTGASVLANSAKAKLLSIYNATDVLILISPDGGVTYPYALPPNGGMVVEAGANGRWIGGAIFAKSITSNSSSGALYIGLTI